jgi:hypothetical protein
MGLEIEFCVEKVNAIAKYMGAAVSEYHGGWRCVCVSYSHACFI